MVVASKRSGVRWFVLAKMPLIKAGVICSVCLNYVIVAHDSDVCKHTSTFVCVSCAIACCIRTWTSSDLYLVAVPLPSPARQTAVVPLRHLY